MIECEHKWPYFITNRGIMSYFCTLHQKSVNDDICSECSDREGETRKDMVQVPNLPRRSDEEIKAIYKVCKGCPLLNPNTRLCKSMYPEPQPPDIVAQHPSIHCPEDRW
jgi:hypothetical protein